LRIKEQETRLILHEHDDDDDDDEYPIDLNGHFGTADAIVRQMNGGSAYHVASNTIQIYVDIIRSAPT
jgi:hypothetical protein